MCSAFRFIACGYFLIWRPQPPCRIFAFYKEFDSSFDPILRHKHFVTSVGILNNLLLVLIAMTIAGFCCKRSVRRLRLSRDAGVACSERVLADASLLSTMMLFASDLRILYQEFIIGLYLSYYLTLSLAQPLSSRPRRFSLYPPLHLCGRNASQHNFVQYTEGVKEKIYVSKRFGAGKWRAWFGRATFAELTCQRDAYLVPCCRCSSTRLWCP